MNLKIYDKITLYTFGSIYIILIVSLIINPPSGSYFNFNSLAGILVGPFFFLAVNNWISEISIEKLSRLFSIVILIHLFFFYYQFIYFILFGEVIDFLGSVTGESSRNMNNLGFVRSSGLFNEPMVFSFFLFSLLVIRHLCLGVRHDIIEGITLFAIFISFSSWGIISVILYISVNFDYKLNGKTILGILGFLFLSILLINYFGLKEYYEFLYETRFSSIQDDSSFQYRYVMTFDIWRNDVKMLFLGNGLASPGKGGVFDLSLLLQIFTNLGLLLGLIFFIIIFFRFYISRKKFKIVILFLTLLSSDLRFQQLYFWFLLSFIVFDFSKIVHINENKVYPKV
jgi:hypothetical protein